MTILCTVFAPALIAAAAGPQDLVISDFGFGGGTPFTGTTVVAGAQVTLASTATEPYASTSFRDTDSPITATVTFTFDVPITEFHLDVSRVRADEYLTAFNLGDPTSLSGDLVNLGGMVTTSALDDFGSGRLSWNGINTTTVSYHVGGDAGALAMDRFGIVTPVVPVGALKGRVVLGPQDLPLQEVQVEVLDSRGLVVASTLTDLDGSFQVSDLSLGEYLVRASIRYDEYEFSTKECDLGESLVTNYPGWDPDARWPVHADAVTTVDPVRFPEPVFLQAGLWSDGAETWTFIHPYLTADAANEPEKALRRLPAFFSVRIPGAPGGSGLVYDHSGLRTAHHDKNANVLARHMGNMREQLACHMAPADEALYFNSVIAHSMGGLITRALVAGDDAPRVGRVVCLDTPHGGTKWPDYLRASGGTFLREDVPRGLSERNLNGTEVGDFEFYPSWNRSHLERRESTRDWLLFGLTDFVVDPDTSADGFGRVFQAFNDDEWRLESWILAPGIFTEYRDLGHSEVHQDSLVRLESIQFILGNLYPDVESRIPDRGGSDDPADGLGVFAWSLDAAAGESSSWQLVIDANSLIYGRFVATGADSDFQVLDGGGAALSLDGYVATELAPGYVYHQFELTNPPPTVEVRLNAGPREEATLACRFQFPNGRRLWADGISPDNGSAAIVASLRDDAGRVLVGSPGTFLAQVLDPDGALVDVSLQDDGQSGDGAARDGVYGGYYPLSPGLEGSYAVTILSASNLAGEVSLRSTLAEFFVPPNSGSFSGPLRPSVPDDNGNGLYDALVLEQDVTVTTTGKLRIVGALRNGLGEIALELSADVPQQATPPALVTVRLVASGGELHRQGVDGPWTLADLTLVDLESGALPVQTAPSWTSDDYIASDFDTPPAPVLTALEPPAGKRNGGYEIIVYGEHLLEATRVRFGAADAAFVATGNGSLLVTVPPAPPLVAGRAPLPYPTPGIDATRYPIHAVDVTVETPWGEMTLPEAYAYRRLRF